MKGSGPVGSRRKTDQPVLLGVNTDKRGNAHNDPVGHDVMLAGRGEMVNRPDRVGPHSNTEQSAFLRNSAKIVHPGVKMSRSQPVTDGPAGPDRTRRPVGTEWEACRTCCGSADGWWPGGQIV